jgi:hypothetical protein
VLSLSKHERTLQAVNTLSNPDSFFEWFFNPYPSTSFLRQAQDRQGERIEKQAFSSLRTGQGERIEKHASGKLDGRTDWKEGLQKPKEIKNGLRTLF